RDGETRTLPCSARVPVLKILGFKRDPVLVPECFWPTFEWIISRRAPEKSRQLSHTRRCLPKRPPTQIIFEVSYEDLLFFSPVPASHESPPLCAVPHGPLFQVSLLP